MMLLKTVRTPRPRLAGRTSHLRHQCHRFLSFVVLWMGLPVGCERPEPTINPLPAAPSETSRQTASAQAPEPTKAAPEVKQVKRQQFTVAAVGDIVFNRMNPSGPALYPFENVASTLKQADVVFGNMEHPLTTRGTRTPNKTEEQIRTLQQDVMRGHPHLVSPTAEAGFNVVSLANNHTMDFSEVGLEDTLQTLDAVQIKHPGAGANWKIAHQPAILTAHGARIAVLAYLAFRKHSSNGACTPAKDNAPGIAIVECNGWFTKTGLRTLKQDIQAARKRADMVMVSFHWGLERQPLPTDYQVALAKKAVDYGADMILGHHPHVLQPLRYYRGKPIMYSLGNFCGIGYTGELSKSAILRTHWQGRKLLKAELLPIRLVDGVPELVNRK